MDNSQFTNLYRHLQKSISQPGNVSFINDIFNKCSLYFLHQYVFCFISIFIHEVHYIDEKMQNNVSNLKRSFLLTKNKVKKKNVLKLLSTYFNIEDNLLSMVLR